MDSTFPYDIGQWRECERYWQEQNEHQLAKVCEQVCDVLKAFGDYVLLANDYNDALKWASDRQVISVFDVGAELLPKQYHVFHFVNNSAACMSLDTLKSYIVVRLDGWKDVDPNEKVKIETHIRTTRWVDPQDAANVRSHLRSKTN